MITALFGATSLGLVGLVVALRRALLDTDASRAQLSRSVVSAQQREAFLSGVLSSSTDCIKVLDLDGKLAFMSEGGQRVMEVSDFNAITGCPWPDFWTGNGHAEAVLAINAAQAGKASCFIGRASTMKGASKWWHVAVSPPRRAVDRRRAAPLAGRRRADPQLRNHRERPTDNRHQREIPIASR